MKKLRPFIAVAVVFVVGLVSGWIGVRAFVQGDTFRQWLSKKISRSLQADGQFESLAWERSTFRSPKFSAIGSDRSKLTSLQLTNISAHIDWWQLLKWRWVIDRISADQVDALIGKKPAKVAAPTTPKQEQGIKLSNFLPSELRIEHIYLPVVNLRWETSHDETGQWVGTTIDAKREGANQWEVQATGGKVRHATYPELQVKEGHATVSQNSIVIRNINTQVKSGGEFWLKGNVATSHSLDANFGCDFSGVNVAQTLPNHWYLAGRGTGHIDYVGDLNRFDEGQFTGSLQIADVTMDLSPLFRKMQQIIKPSRLNQVRLDSISVDLDYKNHRGQFLNLKAVYQDQVRLEGSGSFDPENLAGIIQVGLSPSFLTWLPGSSDQVFTEDRDGLRWTTAKISGTPKEPKEDLSKRLLGAFQNKMSQEFKNSVKDAAKTLLDLFQH